MTKLSSKNRNTFSRNKSKRTGRKTRRMRTRKTGGSKESVIKAAKKAIQAYHISPSDATRVAAESAIATANANCGNRCDWNQEILILPHYGHFDAEKTRPIWYLKTRGEVQWSMDTMPEWANNGADEPVVGTIVNGVTYSLRPKSQSR